MAIHVRLTGKVVDEHGDNHVTMSLAHYDNEVSITPLRGMGSPVFKFSIDELEEALMLARKGRLIKHGR